ncbi:GntP family permease [Pseudonocardia sp. CA-107938]|uniref:GntP family permease n=1 Tax=Pseudonocardia sp. CA-107938 TaxID=3240021 RepID=UPI003D8D5138
MLDWLQHTTPGLITLAVVGIAVLLFLIIKVKLEPFIALIVVGLAVALVGGVSVPDLVGSPLKASDSILEKGFAGILGHIAPIIGLGTVLGAIMERSGGADVLASRLLALFGPKGAPLAMGLTGLIFGIPVFFDIGIFVLAPLVYVAARRGTGSLVRYAMPMLAGLSMTHAFLPPHPGPVNAAGLLHVDLGWIILMGFACGIPAWLVAGVWWGGWIGNRVHVDVPETVSDTEGGRETPEEVDEEVEPTGSAGTTTATRTAVRTAPPSLALISSLVAVPLVLILGATFGTVALPDGNGLRLVLTLLGTPTIALTIAVLLALYLLGIRRGISATELGRITGESLKPIGMILLVVGAGAFFGAVLTATGVGKAVAGSMTAIGLPLIVAAYVISCVLRLAQGSATVALTLTAGIVAPQVEAAGYSQAQVALIVIAISAGSIIASHVNDGGFWIVARYFNMSVRDTLVTWTTLETILSVVGFAAAGLLWLVV